MNNRTVRRLALGFFALLAWVLLPSTSVATWTSYNDMAWQTGQTNYRVTHFSFIDDVDHDYSGQLTRYDTGLTNGVSVTFSVPSTGGFSTVSAPDAASPADLVFNGKVDMSRAVFFAAGQTGTITIAGLSPSQTYRVVMLGNRGNAAYTDRPTTLTLTGADSFVNSSSAGSVISGSLSETTTIVCGTNTGGLVFLYTDINPGSDGQIVFQVTGNAANATYLNTLMLEELPPAVSAWTAYNDIAWYSGQTNYRITKLSFIDDANHDLSGGLVRYEDGQLSGVTATFAGGAGAGYSILGSLTVGSPADLLFSGKVDLNTNVFLPSGVSGTITLSGLTAGRLYEVNLVGARGEPTYTTRKTVITISGADSFINASTAGAVISNDTTVITSGTNAGGQLFTYTAIAPGSDGQIVLTMSGNAGASAYINAMKVELLSEDPAAPSVANGTATVNGPTAATLGGSLTSTGTLPTDVWLYWMAGSDGGTNKAGWASSLALGTKTVGSLSQTVTNLAAGTTNYFRYYASNSLGGTWASPAVSFYTPAFLITSSVPFGVASRRQGYASNRRAGVIVSEIMYDPPSPYGDEGEYIELYNTQSYPEDLSGWRLAGEVDFAFTNGTTIPARGFLVVAKNPSWIMGSYQISGVLGPYNNKLSDGGGVVRIRDDEDAILFEAEYDDKGEWPAAAAGAGHSLVLTKPDYGEGSVLAWEASAVMYGNPGASNQTISSTYNLQNVCLNEILTHTDPPQEDTIELFNRGTGVVDITGCWITDNPAVFKYQIPSRTIAATSCVSFSQAVLGYGLSRQGGTIYVFNPAKDMVLDAVRYESQENGVSFGRFPDGAPTFHELSTLTTGKVNRTSSLKIRDIVINEIMFNPPTGDDNDEFVELYNRGSSSVNIGYWRFNDGIDYMFPPGTIVPTNGYVVVTKDREQFMGKHTNVIGSVVFGDYGGTLSDNGERLALAKPDDTNYPYQDFVVMDEVRYADGWTEQADGNGSSLELRDPRADNRLAASWADSDESAKAPWTTLELTANLDDEDDPVTAGWATDATENWWGPSMVPYYLKQIQIFLNGQGECLIDELHVTRGGTEFVQNPSLDAGAANWLMGHRNGTHKESTWISSGGSNNTGCIQLKSSGGGAPGINSIAATLNSGITTNDVGIKLTLKARWLKGNPALQARLVGNGLWLDGQLVLPDSLGTPGVRNSRYVANIGPDISDMFYTPVLPPSGSNVTVTARLQDIDGVQGADIKWRKDPDTGYTTVAMSDAGTGGDAIANDGVWSGLIPGQSTTNVVCFYISARDNNGATVRVYPDLAPTQEVYVIFGVTNGAVGNYGVFRFIVPPSRDRDTSQSAYWGWERMDNAYWDVTLLYNDSRIIPNAGTRFGGSIETRPKPGIDMPIYDGEQTYPANFREANQSHYFKLPKENRLCGSTYFNLQNLNNQNRARPLFAPGDPTFVAEDIMGWIARDVGLKATRQRYLHVFGNDYHKGIIFADQMTPENEFIDAYLPDSTDGGTFDLKGSPGEVAKTATAANYYGQTNNAMGRDYATPVIGASRHDDGTLRMEMYRLMWDKKFTDPRDTDVSAVANVAVAIDRPIDSSASSQKAYMLALDKVVDWEEWAREMAFRKCVGDTDAWGNAGPKNTYMHIPKNGKAILLPFGYDSGFGVAGYAQNDDNRSTLPTANIFCPWDSSVTMCDDSVLSNQFFKCYAVRRALWRGVRDVLEGPMSASQLNAQIDKLFMAHSNNNIQAWKNMKPGADDSLVMTAAELAEVKAWPATRRSWIINTSGEYYSALTNTTFSASASGSTTARVFQITGNAPIQAKTLKVNGVAMRDIDVTWTSETAYTLDMPAVTNGSLNYAVSAWDNMDHQVGSTQNVSVNYTGTISSPSGQIVITEIMYDPAESGGGFVELYNKHALEAFDLAGLRLNGADFTFPVGSIIGPQQYKVIVASEPVFYKAYTNDPTIVLGQYSGTLDNGGETLSLEVPAGLTNIVSTNLGIVVTNVFTNYSAIDTVTYEDDAPWPSEVRGSGHSLQLIDLNQDNNRLANWTTTRRWKQVTMTGTANTTTLYLYFDNGAPGPVLLDDIRLVTGLVAGTGMNLVTNGSFDEAYPSMWSVAPAYAESKILSGVGRDGGDVLKMEATSADTTGIRQHIPTVVSGQVYTLSYWYLPLGTGGTFQVRFSGSWVASTNSAAMGSASSPGKANSVAGTLNTIPVASISEIMPDNSSTPVDNFGDADAWLELFNGGSSNYNLTSGGFYLTGDYDNLTAWAFPNSPTLSAGARRLVWLDGETGETSGTNHLHTSFIADTGTGHVALVQINNGRTTVVDYVNYSLIPVNKSYGNYPDSNSMARIIFDTPTPSAVNNPVSQTNLAIRINEWCAVNKNVLADPADGQFEDWIELFNPNGSSVDLSGWMLTDNLDQPDKYVMPAGRSIPALSYMLIWVDNEEGQTTASSELHAGFSLSGNGETLGLFSPDGRLVDYTVFGAQLDNVSEGQYPDGSAVSYQMAVPSPRTTNLLFQATSMTSTGGIVRIVWNVRPSTQYRLMYTDTAGGTNWTAYGPDLQTNASAVQIDVPATTSRRFYRLTRP